ncbi:MAG: phosphopentomutase [Christensenellaceae bacterium]|nr:phosphopentomutase [Christensenellaceae bacterium]
MKRVFLTVLDGAGVGWLPDAANYGDVGSCTIGHVVEKCHPQLPNMARMGLGHIEGTSYPADESAVGAYGRAMEASAGKDTTTGHWEISGVRLEKPFPTFPNGFPAEFIAKYEAAIGHKVIGNKPASGTAILDELGEEHIANKTPIVYTSADSVFQIACHEDIFSREELYQMCRVAREMLQGDLCVGRVIARPFVGEKAGAFKRTAGRRDFAVPPFGKTLLDAVKEAGMESLGVGKIEDIFDHQGLTGSNHAAGNPACIEAWLDYMRKPFDGLCFTNLVDTDMQYGHRNDPEGFAGALEYFDQKLPEIQSLLGEDDLLIVTADHGCDPTFPGTDHTREHIPLMVWHKKMTKLVDLGTRATYADIAATCAEWLGLPDRFGATSFANELK